MSEDLRIIRKMDYGPEIDQFAFFCPGCRCAHWFRTRGPAPNWTWNGDFYKPTIRASILTWWDEGSPAVQKRCHSFVTDGQIQFLADSSHALAGKTVPLEPF